MTKPSKSLPCYGGFKMKIYLCKTRTGQLAAVQAKNLLLGTGLAQQTLAGVWNLADIDKDGQYHEEINCKPSFTQTFYRQVEY